ncbi:hypothetical protein PFLUV_G00127590 [Perca fluviatilis]|uniref:Uncharacterized protein n=1 Tax=Perca fluviatilis TaxID=8168 RepID=A0A6A5E8C7_PERFL|nr:hypothetical protein PFLUV_G00127590 [Perca fluviatilis]
MWKVVQVGVRRAVGVRVRRVPAAARAGSVRGSEAAAARSLTRQLCSRAGRSCTVDPGLEEQFVFVDCTDPEEQQRQEDTVHQLSVSASSPPLAPPPHLAPPSGSPSSGSSPPPSRPRAPLLIRLLPPPSDLTLPVFLLSCRVRAWNQLSECGEPHSHHAHDGERIKTLPSAAS